MNETLSDLVKRRGFRTLKNEWTHEGTDFSFAVFHNLKGQTVLRVCEATTTDSQQVSMPLTVARAREIAGALLAVAETADGEKCRLMAQSLRSGLDGEEKEKVE